MYEINGISFSEAVSRLQWEDDVGVLEMRLAEEQSETFAGLWIEHEPTYRVVVAFTGDGEEIIQPYIVGKPLADKVEVRSAEVSLVELRRVQLELSDLVWELNIPAAISIFLEESIVELEITDQARFDAVLLLANATLPEHVVVKAIYEPVGDNPPFDVTPEPSILMPQLQMRSPDFMQALLIGQLVVEDGCLRVRSGEHSVLIIWQADYYLNNRDGTIEILNETGKVVAQVGETVEMGGGFELLTAELEALLREPIPEECNRPEGVWVMGEL